jgi:hypothetical protein
VKSTLAACLLWLTLASAAESATITLSWDGGPGAHPLNRTHLAGTTATVVATATGFEQPVRGIQVVVRVRSQYDGVPDAWRFEPGGCAAGGFSTPEIAVDPGVPFLTGPNVQRVSQAKYEFGVERFVFAIIHDPVAVPFAARYTIAQFQFDLSKAFDGFGLKADSCGCLEQPQAAHLLSASWLAADGNEYAFTVVEECLGWEDPNNSVSCPFFGCDLCDPDPPPPPHNPCTDQQPTAAAPRTWGSVKALYR